MSRYPESLAQRMIIDDYEYQLFELRKKLDEIVHCWNCEYGIDGGKYCAEGCIDCGDWRNVEPDGFCAWGIKKGDDR